MTPFPPSDFNVYSDSSLMILGASDGQNVQSNLLKIDKSKSQTVEKAIYGFARMSVGMGDWRWYPDIPGLDDMPMEIRPLAFIAKMAGFDGDLREMRTTFETMNAIKSESLSFVKKIT